MVEGRCAVLIWILDVLCHARLAIQPVLSRHRAHQPSRGASWSFKDKPYQVTWFLCDPLVTNDPLVLWVYRMFSGLTSRNLQSTTWISCQSPWVLDCLFRYLG
jgi:hypothetical protein